MRVWLRRLEMKRYQYILLGTLVCLFSLFLGCAKSGSESAAIDPAKLTAYAPLPEVAPGKEPITEEKVALGRMLYYEPRLSKSQKISCNSCHLLTQYGVDNKPTSRRPQGAERRSQLPDRLQCCHPFRAVLGWPRPGRRRTSQRSGAESGRDGHDVRKGSCRGPEVDARIRGSRSRRLSPKTKIRSRTTTWARRSERLSAN